MVPGILQLFSSPIGAGNSVKFWGGHGAVPRPTKVRCKSASNSGAQPREACLQNLRGCAPRRWRRPKSAGAQSRAGRPKCQGSGGGCGCSGGFGRSGSILGWLRTAPAILAADWAAVAVPAVSLGGQLGAARGQPVYRDFFTIVAAVRAGQPVVRTAAGRGWSSVPNTCAGPRRTPLGLLDSLGLTHP